MFLFVVIVHFTGLALLMMMSTMKTAKLYNGFNKMKLYPTLIEAHPRQPRH